MIGRHIQSFEEILNTLENDEFSSAILNLKNIKLNAAEVDQLLLVLPKNPHIVRLTLGEMVEVPFSKLSKLKSIIRNHSSLSSCSSERTSVSSVESDHLQFNQGSKDKYGNHSERALFETQLAYAIIKNSSLDIIVKINQSILQYIKTNTSIYELMAKEIKNDLLEIELMTKDEVDREAIDLFEKLLIEGEPIVSIELHKIFFEKFFNPQLVNSFRSHSLSSLSVLAQQNLFTQVQNGHQTLFNDIEKIFRPDSQFSDINRGRRACSVEKPSKNFGITEEKHTPDWAKNWHSRNINHAKEIYRRNYSSPTIKFHEQHKIPFISGASGTVGFVLTGILFLIKPTPSEMKKYLNILAATLIGAGHHSYYEVMQVAANIKLFCSSYRVSERGLFQNNDDQYFIWSSAIPPENIYQTCLTEEFKRTDAYLKLSQEFSQYLSVGAQSSMNLGY